MRIIIWRILKYLPHIFYVFNAYTTYFNPDSSYVTRILTVFNAYYMYLDFVINPHSTYLYTFYVFIKSLYAYDTLHT